jgi:hypothetical protein
MTSRSLFTYNEAASPILGPRLFSPAGRDAIFDIFVVFRQVPESNIFKYRSEVAELLKLILNFVSSVETNELRKAKRVLLL